MFAWICVSSSVVLLRDALVDLNLPGEGGTWALLWGWEFQSKSQVCEGTPFLLTASSRGHGKALSKCLPTWLQWQWTKAGEGRPHLWLILRRWPPAASGLNTQQLPPWQPPPLHPSLPSRPVGSSLQGCFMISDSQWPSFIHLPTLTDTDYVYISYNYIRRFLYVYIYFVWKGCQAFMLSLPFDQSSYNGSHLTSLT